MKNAPAPFGEFPNGGAIFYLLRWSCPFRLRGLSTVQQVGLINPQGKKRHRKIYIPKTCTSNASPIKKLNVMA